MNRTQRNLERLKLLTPTKNNVTIYRDRSRHGTDFSVYVGVTCVGCFLGDDKELEKYVNLIGEENIKEGLDNR
jgi:hypothetical protein